MISKNRMLSEDCKEVCRSLGYDVSGNDNDKQMPSSYASGETLPYDKAYIFVLNKLGLKANPQFEQLFELFQSRYERFVDQNQNAADLSVLFMDWYQHANTEGFTPGEYFYYELFNKDAEERRTFISSRDKAALKKLNDPLRFAYLSNRAIFNEHFSDQITREWVNGVTRGRQEIQEFIAKHPVFFVKASNANYKYKPAIIDSSKYQENVLFELMHYKGLLAETIIEQHEQLAEINPSSLNTVRAVVRSDGQEAKVVAAAASFGKDGDVYDSFTRTGLAASVDVESGTINSPLVDKYNNVYEKHPDTNASIIGMVYPAWNQICDVVCKAMLDFPELVNAGWDVAVRKDGGVELMGGVAGNNYIAMQMPNQRGIRNLYEDVLE